MPKECLEVVFLENNFEVLLKASMPLCLSGLDYARSPCMEPLS